MSLERDLVRRATVADVPRMAALAVDRYPGDLDQLVEQLRSYIAVPETCAGFVVAEDGDITGWGMARHVESTAVDEEHAPPGWYLMGVVVRPDRHRRGHGAALTRARLDWLGSRTDRVRYFTESDNEASVRLHASFGFQPVRDGLTHRSLTFDGGPMTLYELDLTS